MQRRPETMVVVFPLAWFLFLVALSGCSIRQHDSHPWLESPGQWTDQDVARIWHESPWVRVKTVKQSRLVGPLPNLFESYWDFETRTSSVTFNPQMASEDSWQVLGLQYRVRWVSARVMCLAQHPWVLEDPGDDTCTERPDEYRILATLPWVDSPTGELNLRRHSYLRPRAIGRVVAPFSVEHVMGNQFLLKFPMWLPDGRPVLGLNETGVTVVLSVGKKRWKVKFSPQEMVGPAGRDW